MSDDARLIVGNVSTDMAPGERIRAARKPRWHSLNLVDVAVLSELADGARWDEIADALGCELEDAQRRYGPTWAAWLAGAYDDDEVALGDFSVRLGDDDDLGVTAATIDQWYQRHTDPWDITESEPVSRLLVDGETSARDR